jgi:predicted AAA+ superfamily ATPase
MVGRYLDANIREDLKKKMVLLAGPRQSGKTSLGLSLLNPATPENPFELGCARTPQSNHPK